MTNKRLGKKYKHGERISLYVGRDVSEEFLDWMNMQSNLTAFFYYAALQLYKQTGKIDVSTVMPARLNYDLSSIEQQSQQSAIQAQPIVKPQENKPKEDPEEENTWAGLDDFEDPYA